MCFVLEMEMVIVGRERKYNKARLVQLKGFERHSTHFRVLQVELVSIVYLGDH